MHIKPKKSLGQNFLVDKNIRRKIVAACNLSADDLVLEIGPGEGDLTGLLAEGAGEVYAIELDRRLIPGLEKKLTPYPNCRVLNRDILKFDIEGFFRERACRRKIKVVGNIPYYISSPIIENLIAYRHCIEDVFMTVQKEFGRRVSAPPGSKEYGAFSCFVGYYAEARILFEI
jgi:16S rRNA (adenine1518-N6/adenine1519-N6)-dimethyltransferase